MSHLVIRCEMRKRDNIRCYLSQEYLQSFYAFCQSVGGPTEEVMCGILAVRIKHVDLISRSYHIRLFVFLIFPCSICVCYQFEADRRAINITLNSFGTELSKEDRKKLYPTIGLPAHTLHSNSCTHTLCLDACLSFPLSSHVSGMM